MDIDMENFNLIVFTMKGCPFCSQFKDMLDEQNIVYHERDIDENKEEYDLFSEITKNDMIPSFMIIEKYGENYQSYLYAPERDYNELTEAVEIIKGHII
jgi:glutaredoxin